LAEMNKVIFAVLLLLALLATSVRADCAEGNYERCSDLKREDCTTEDDAVDLVFDEDEFLREVCCPSETKCVCDFSSDKIGDVFDDDEGTTAQDLVECIMPSGARSGYTFMVVIGAIGIFVCCPCLLIGAILMILFFPCFYIVLIICLPCFAPVVLVIIGSEFLSRHKAPVHCDDENMDDAFILNVNLQCD